MSNSLVERHDRVYAPVITWDSDLDIVAADGSWVTDVEGEKYLDFACGCSARSARQTVARRRSLPIRVARDRSREGPCGDTRLDREALLHEFGR
jgi:hypothetical protein